MKIQVTENKSTGTLNPIETSVRVFVDNDYNYGYFVPEHTLFGLLTEEQQGVYLASDDVKLDVEIEVAEKIIEAGRTPFAKRKLR